MKWIKQKTNQMHLTHYLPKYPALWDTGIHVSTQTRDVSLKLRITGSRMEPGSTIHKFLGWFWTMSSKHSHLVTLVPPSYMVSLPPASALAALGENKAR